MKRRIASALPAVVGPVAIVVTVVVVLRDFAFAARLTTQHVDILSFWLPNHCFLGRTLASGHLPVLNPYTMGGVPFAADPQSGWMYLPAMALYAALPCYRAAAWFITLNPLVAGLGVYAFLRVEGVTRAGATVGGLVLALLVADSTIALELPFAGTLAWTAVTLAGAARYLRASGWGARLPWAGLTGIAWSQLAAAHFSHGMVVGTAAVAAYVAATLVRGGVRSRSAGQSIALAGALLAIVPLVSLAYLWPRLGYLSESTIGQGYRRFAELASEVTGADPGYSVGQVTGGLRASWPLALAVSPGPYLGAAASMVALAGWWDRRRRHLVIAFAALGVASYAATLQGVSSLLGRWIGSWPLADVYLHAPGRLRYGTLLAIPILVGIGVDAWRSADRRRRWVLLVPGVLCWWALPLVTGVQRDGPWLFLTGVVLAGGLAAWSTLWTAAHEALGALLPLLVAVELTASGLLGQIPAYSTDTGERLRTPLTGVIGPIGRANVDGAAYVDVTGIAGTVRSFGGGRFLALGPAGADRVTQLRDPAFWSLLANQRAMLFGLEDVEGYNPSQLPRYWTFVRAVDPRPMRYNAASIRRLDTAVRDLFQVEWVTAPASRPPPAPGAEAVALDGQWVLYRLPDVPGRTSVFTTWMGVPGEREALDVVTSPAFQPDRDVVVEGLVGQPGSETSPAGTVRSTTTGLGSATIDVVAPAPAIVLVRIPYAAHWQATVDDRPAAVVPADYLLQAVPVGQGAHRIELRYDDPTIGWSVLGSIVALLALGIGAVALRRAGRRGSRESGTAEQGSR